MKWNDPHRNNLKESPPRNGLLRMDVSHASSFKEKPSINGHLKVDPEANSFKEITPTHGYVGSWKILFWEW